MNPNTCSGSSSRGPRYPRMVISRAPLRISFVGGGSDLPPGTGRTFSAAIDKYVYVMAKWRNDDRVIMNWREKETVSLAAELQHQLAREALQMLGVHRGIEIATFADVPGVGSGLGSSAATTIAIVQAVSALTGVWLTPSSLARAAVEVELERLKRKGGSQDQWICALGGIQMLDHSHGRCVAQKSVQVSQSQSALLPRNFVLFSPPENDSGRDADKILSTKKDGESFYTCCCMLVDRFHDAFLSENWKDCVSLVGEHDTLKRCTFGGYTPEKVGELDSVAPHRWKICGAGRSGHLLVGVRPEFREKVIVDVEGVWGRELPWSVSLDGATVIHAE